MQTCWNQNLIAMEVVVLPPLVDEQATSGIDDIWPLRIQEMHVPQGPAEHAQRQPSSILYAALVRFKRPPAKP